MQPRMSVENTEIVDVWHELLDRHARSVSALERALQHEHGLGVSEYEVLERLRVERAVGPAACRSSPRRCT